MGAPITFPDAAAIWNQRYAGSEFLFGTEPNAWLREHVSALSRGGRILSVADGEGRDSVWLAKQGFAVDAFDISERAVETAREFAQREGASIKFTLAGVDAFAWPESLYDGVVAIFVQFADPATRSRLFERIVRSLKPGGVLILQGYTPKQLEFKTGGPSIRTHLYTREMLESAFAGMTILEMRDYEAEIHEGTGHSGVSALMGVMARK